MSTCLSNYRLCPETNLVPSGNAMIQLPPFLLWVLDPSVDIRISDFYQIWWNKDSEEGCTVQCSINKYIHLGIE